MRHSMGRDTAWGRGGRGAKGDPRGASAGQQAWGSQGSEGRRWDATKQPQGHMPGCTRRGSQGNKGQRGKRKQFGGGAAKLDASVLLSAGTCDIGGS